MPDLINPDNSDADAEVIPPVVQSHSIQRLQIGFAGLAAMVLMVGLASVVMDRVDEAEATLEPEPGDALPAEADLPTQNDPLADAGLVPDLPAEPEPEATTTGAATPQANEAAQN